MIECMEWQQGDARNEDQWSVGDDSHWRRKSQFTFVSATVSALHPPEISYDEILIPMVMLPLGEAFVRLWSCKDGPSSMR